MWLIFKLIHDFTKNIIKEVKNMAYKKPDYIQIEEDLYTPFVVVVVLCAAVIISTSGGC